MTITLLQVDADPATLLPKYTGQQFRQGQAATHGAGFGRQLGGRSGFRVGTPSTALTATSTTWTLTPVSAMLDPDFATHQGMYGWASDANESGTMTPADQTNPRKDIVYIQVNDKNLDGSGELSAPLVYLAGNPAPSPVAPPLPDRAFLVGTITVPKVGGGAPSVVLNSARYVSAGGVLPVSSAADRPSNPYVGLTVSRLDRDGWLQTYTGVGTASGWEYQRASRRVHAVVNGTNFINRTGSVNRLIHTMPASALMKPYPQVIDVFARIALTCPSITAGTLQEWLAVSTGTSVVTASQGRASNTFTVASSTVVQTLQASTGPQNLAANTDPLARLWIERATSSSIDTTVSVDPTFTKMWADLRPQDD